jgi:hypothetical protein
MTRFKRGTGVAYSVITPETPLEELEEFLVTNDFAIGGLDLIDNLAAPNVDLDSYRSQPEIRARAGDKGRSNCELTWSLHSWRCSDTCVCPELCDTARSLSGHGYHFVYMEHL